MVCDRASMNAGRTVFSQLLDLLPRRAFDLAIERYQGDKKLRRFSCMHQLLCMVFAQLTGRSSLRETVTCLRALGSRRYHCGIRTTPARSTLAKANERRDFRIFMDTALSMIASAQLELPVDADLRRMKIHAFAIDSTAIELETTPGCIYNHGSGGPGGPAMPASSLSSRPLQRRTCGGRRDR